MLQCLTIIYSKMICLLKRLHSVFRIDLFSFSSHYKFQVGRIIDLHYFLSRGIVDYLCAHLIQYSYTPNILNVEPHSTAIIQRYRSDSRESHSVIIFSKTLISLSPSNLQVFEILFKQSYTTRLMQRFHILLSAISQDFFAHLYQLSPGSSTDASLMLLQR